MEEKKLFLLDAYALIFRAYYALIRSPRFTTNGFNTSAVFGFVNTLQDIIKKENPTHIAVCFDPPGPTFRHIEYEKYKADREETPEDIRKAVPVIKEIINAYHIPIIEVMGYEADDVIGTLALKSQEYGFETYMMTPDKDYGQLVREHVKVFKPAYKGGEYEIRGVEEICARYQLTNPCQVIDLLALMGDKVDNIPGCPGVGEVTAIKLIKEFGSVENLLENTGNLKGALRRKVEENAENIRFSKYLATIKTDVPVEFNEEELKREEPDNTTLRAIFERLEFRTLITRLLNGKEAKVEEKSKEPEAINAQTSLFDFNAPDEAEEIPTTRGNIDNTVHSYTVLDSIDDVKNTVTKVLQHSEAGFALMIDGADFMTAVPRAVALSVEAHHGYYIPLTSAEMLEAVRPIFESEKLVKVGDNVKFDSIVLRRNGIKLAAPYFDINLAHYIIQPEQSHGYMRVAETVLHYDTLDVDKVFETKLKKHKNCDLIDAELIKNFACEQADIVLQLKPKLLKDVEAESMDKLLYDIELPLLEVLADMEYTGVRVDESVLNRISAVLTTQMNNIEKEIFELAGEEFNVASPVKVGEILFDKLKIDEKAKKTKTGRYTTTEEVLTKLAGRHPIVQKILDIRGIRKLLTTYVNALPALISPVDGRIHTTYNQTVTATGRLSSANPNLQNVPVRNDEGKVIREAFIPAEGNIFYSADYSQIELRLVADMSKDTAMVSSFLNGEDIHRATAAKIYHVGLDEVTDTQRRHAKTANFGILYGISAFGLADRLHIPRYEAKMLIDGYMATYPGVQQYMERTIEDAKKSGYVTTLFGRRRMLPDINSHNSVVRSFNERNAINAPIQGTAADVIKIAMVRIYKRFAAEGIKSKMIMQVHDELNFDVLPGEIDRVNAIVKEEMEGAYSGGVPLIPSSGTGKNWLEAH